MSSTQQPPQAPPTNDPPISALTPHGTPIILPGVSVKGTPPTLDPAAVALLQNAYQAIPPGTIKTPLGQNWGYVLALCVPLILTTYQNIKEIWSGPAALAVVAKQADDDHKSIDGLKAQIEAVSKSVEAEVRASETAHKDLNNKLDRILWSLPQPTSGPWHP